MTVKPFKSLKSGQDDQKQFDFFPKDEEPRVIVNGSVFDDEERQEIERMIDERIIQHLLRGNISNG